MKRRVLIGLLAVGAIIGFASGFRRLHQQAHDRHERFGRGHWERRVAETCARAAHDVFDERAKKAP